MVSRESVKTSVTWRSHALRIASVILGGVGAVYVTSGFLSLVWATDYPGDLENLWVQQRCVAANADPIETRARLEGLGYLLTLEDTQDPCKAWLARCTYPPWAIATLDFIVPPVSKNVTRVYFAILNVIAMGLIACWAFQDGRIAGQSWACAFTTGALAIFANGVCLRVGQLSILVTLFLVGMLVCERKEKQGWAGVLLALAAVKPHISVPFGLILLMRRRWRGLAVLFGYFLITTCIVCLRVRTTPWQTLIQTIPEMHSLGGQLHFGVFDPLRRLGVSKPVVTALGLGLGSAAGLVLIWCYRRRATLDLMAIAAVIGQLWTYHRRYDQVVIVFLLVALGRLVAIRRTPWAVVGLAAVGLSLWLPHRDVDWFGWPATLQHAAWIVGLVILLGHRPPGTASLHAIVSGNNKPERTGELVSSVASAQVN